MKITKFKNIFGGAALGLAILAGGAAATHAQETQTQPQAGQNTEKQWKKHRRGDGFRRGDKLGRAERGGMRQFSRLNLTDEQKEQIKQLHERYRDHNKAIREQLRTARESNDTAKSEQLFAQYKEDHKKMRAEMLTILTAEQRTQLEQFQTERKQQREQRRQLFEQRRKQREAQPAPNVN